jgi:hypothetical protein
MASTAAILPSSTADNPDNAPPKFPIGVRTADAITTFLITVYLFRYKISLILNNLKMQTIE